MKGESMISISDYIEKGVNLINKNQEQLQNSIRRRQRNPYFWWYAVFPTGTACYQKIIRLQNGESFRVEITAGIKRLDGCSVYIQLFKPGGGAYVKYLKLTVGSESSDGLVEVQKLNPTLQVIEDDLISIFESLCLTYRD
jgi:hypothetical protein